MQRTHGCWRANKHMGCHQSSSSAHGCHEPTIKEQRCLEQHANATSDHEDVQFGDVLAVEKDGVSGWFP
jgi:hypothetical protein